MSSPLQKAFAAKKKVVVLGSPQPVVPVANAALLLKEFNDDLKALKALSRIEDKVEHKRVQLLPKYLPMLKGWIKSNTKFDPAFCIVIVWLLDVNNIEQFFKWCGVAIDNGLSMPPQIKRDWKTFCAESISEWAQKQGEKGHSAEPHLSQILEKLDSGEWQIFEKVAAKIYKVAGLALLRNEKGEVNPSYIGDIVTLEKSLTLLSKAQEFYEKIGVGELINRRIPARIAALKKFAEQ